MPFESEWMLAGVAQEDEHHAFFHDLLASQVYVLGIPEVPTNDGVGQRGLNVQLVKFSDCEGFFVPFFTSEVAVHASLVARRGTRPNHLRLRCRDLFEMTKGSRLVLDPYSPNSKTYLPPEIEALLAGREPERRGEDVREPRPSELPPFDVTPARPDLTTERRRFPRRK